MKRLLIRRSVLALSALTLILTAASCNPNRNNPNYSGSQTQPGTVASPGTSGGYSGNTGSVSGAGDASNTGSSSSTGTSSGSR